jgi:hypothetical protein
VAPQIPVQQPIQPQLQPQTQQNNNLPINQLYGQTQQPQLYNYGQQQFNQLPVQQQMNFGGMNQPYNMANQSYNNQKNPMAYNQNIHANQPQQHGYGQFGYQQPINPIQPGGYNQSYSQPSQQYNQPQSSNCLLTYNSRPSLI